MTIGARFWAHWRLKLGLGLLLTVAFWTGYSYLGRHAAFPPHTLPATWIDRSIPFDPEIWGWVYLSQLMLTGFLPWFLGTRDEMLRFASSFALLSAMSFLIFFFFPVASPRPVSVTESSAMRFIVGYDGTLNAFPSLHAGFAVLTAIVAWRIFSPTLPMLSAVVATTWGTAVLYGTIATRQHYAIDLAAGAGLGVLAGWLAWRKVPVAAAAATMRRNEGVTSQAGCR